MAKEPNSILASDYTKIAFVRTATKEQYELARQSLKDKLNFGSMTGPVEFDQARAIAEAEALALKFDYGATYYESYLGQRIVDDVKKVYVDCMRAQTVGPGLRLWLDREEGDYYFLHGIYVGNDAKSRGQLVREELIEDNIGVIKVPASWGPRVEREVVVKKGKTPGGMVSFTVGQQVGTFVVIADSERVRMLSSERRGPDMSVRSGGSVSCERHTLDQCLVPEHLNGYFFPGTVKFDGSQPAGTGFEVTKDSTSEVCVRVWALSAACQSEVRIDGNPVVVERYPLGP